MAAPNLFDFATKELSQDAFICWLAAWADPSCQTVDDLLHRTAISFVDRLLEVGRGPKVSSYSSVTIRRQDEKTDVLVVVNGEVAILIEDKTDTSDHSDQLRRYKAGVASKFAADKVAAVYFKSGDQCDYSSAEQAGYGCFLRQDFLEILDRGEALGVDNDIFTDFRRHLLKVEEEVRKFASMPPDSWEPRQWTGFFMALRERLGEGDWAKRGNAGGGSWTFRWHDRDGKYLRLHGDQLAFCLHVTDETERDAKWNEWNRMLLARNGTGGMNVTPARRKLGTRMTVAVLDGGDYRQRDGRGLLDLGQTVDTLRQAEVLMDAALGTP